MPRVSAGAAPLRYGRGARVVRARKPDATPVSDRIHDVPSQSRLIVISMAVGVALGCLFPNRPPAEPGFRASDLAVLSSLFLRMVKVLIAPLLFSTLVVGIAGHGDDMKKVGRLALRSLVYFEVVTTLALLVGLAAVNVARPGVGVRLAGATGVTLATAGPTFSGVVEHLVPTSLFAAAAGNDVLQIVVFAVVFAVAVARAPTPARARVLGLCESVSAVMFGFVGIVTRVAPVGVGAAMAVAVGTSGVRVLRHLGALVLTLYGALVVFAVVVLLPIALLARVPLRRFWRAVKEPWLIAFTTSSSEAALPLALERMERLGVPRRVAAFVLPAGYAFNMDGTTLYLALASVFVAQAAGIAMPLSRQVVMMLTLMLTSKGAAAVPRSSIVILAGALAQFGLPLQGVAVILGVDALMDMARTSVNLVGNCLATVVMARWDGSLRPPTDDAPERAPRAEAPNARERGAARRADPAPADDVWDVTPASVSRFGDSCG
jgi:proton glutamate symport protein